MTRAARPGPRRAAVLVAALVGAAAVLAVSGSAGAEPQEERLTFVGSAPNGEVGAVRHARSTQANSRARAGETLLPRGHTASPAMARSVDLIGAPDRWAAGHRGSGEVVVVIDTGVAPDFGGALIGQACFAGDAETGFCSDEGDYEAFSQGCFDLGVCGPGDLLDDSAALPCGSVDPPSGCQHGSAVASIVARDDPEVAGVAPDASVYAIRVFGSDPGQADLVDIFLALAHTVDLVDAGLPVVSVNVSLATAALFAGDCRPHTGGLGAATADAMDALLDRRVVTTVASGNDGIGGAIGFPACLSSAVAVGATDLDDDVATFTNWSSMLDLFAPGTGDATGDPLIIPSAPGYDAAWQGTSFAAPHVAGAVALVADEYPRSTGLQRTWFLGAGGVRVPFGETSRPRIALGSAAEVLPAGRLFPGGASTVAAQRRAVADLDGDGRDDLVLHGIGAASDGIYYGGGSWSLERTARSIGGDYYPLTGNFRGAKRSGGPVNEEVLFYAPGSSADVLWRVSPGRVITSTSLQVNGTYLPVVGDLDGDGWDDIIWYAPGTPKDTIWFGGSTGFTSKPRNVDGTYAPAVLDLDCDGRDEVLWHAPGTAPDRRWDISPSRTITTSTASFGHGTYTIATGNLDGDELGGHPCEDLVLHAPGPAHDAIVYGGPAPSIIAGTGVGTYRPITVDADADGRDEVLWYGVGTAPDAFWQVSASRQVSGLPLSVSGTYSPIVGDLDGDGASEVVWHRAATSVPVWWGVAGAP